MLTKGLCKTAYALLFVFAAVIVFNNAFVGAATSYVTKKNFVMPYLELFAIAVLFVILLVRLGKNHPVYLPDSPLIVAVLCVGLFILQTYLAFQTIFITVSWDAGRVLSDAIYAANGWYGSMDADYYSYYPNNRGIFLLDYLVCKRLAVHGALSVKAVLCEIVKIESFVSAVTAFFVHRTTKLVTLSNTSAWVAWGIYALLLGLSGWVIVPYTDMTVIAFPVIIFYLYLKMDDTGMDYLRWFFIFLMTVIGFTMKPTVAIMLIAIYACGLVTWFPVMIKYLSGKNRLLMLSRLFVVLLIGVLTIVATDHLFKTAIADTGLVIDEEKNTGPLHMLMMGLNDSNDGAMTWDDIAFSQKFETKEERTEAQLGRIKMIMDSYRPKSFISHLSRKALVVFNDGTFAWGEEGGFYDRPLSLGFPGDWFREYTYKGGRHYSGFSTIFQLIWYMVLIMLLFVGCIPCNERHMIPVVSVLGIIIFNLMFEARARYLIVYAPMIIIVAVMGLEAMWKKRKTD